MSENKILSSASVKQPSAIRWTIAVSVMLQGMALAWLIVFPLLHPATLPRLNGTPRIVPLVQFHPPLKPRVIPVNLQRTHSSLAHALQVPFTHAALAAVRQAGMISHAPANDLAEAPLLPVGGGMSTNLTLANGPGGGKETVGLVVSAAVPAAKVKTEPVRISSGVSAGLLLTPIRPIYPRIAVVSKQEGTVVVTAVIDRSGRITRLQVLSGPIMLRTAAVDAVEAARYRPFLLNGEATDVVTTISITFHLAG